MVQNFNKIMLKKFSHFNMTGANNALNYTNVLVRGLF